jgi:hypothetical protein
MLTVAQLFVTVIERSWVNKTIKIVINYIEIQDVFHRNFSFLRLSKERIDGFNYPANGSSG